jgi:hypothetical protein
MVSVQGSITYQGLTATFNTHTRDAYGTLQFLTGVDILAGRGTSGSFIQRSGAPGAWPTESFMSNMVIELGFHVEAPTQALRNSAVNRLLQVIPVGGTDVSELATLQLDMADASKIAYVRRSGPVKETKLNSCASYLSMAVASPDYRLYGAILKTASLDEPDPGTPLTVPLTPPFTLGDKPTVASGVVTNNGYLATGGVITIFGPRIGPGVYNSTTGEYIVFSSLTMTGSKVLVIDLLNKVATLNGQFVSADVDSTWFEFAPQTATRLELMGSSTTLAGGTVAWRDAYEN